MSLNSSFTVIVPATTANIGPGFDCLGAALTLYNQFKFTETASSNLEIKVVGKEAAKVSCDQDNLLYQALIKLYENIGQKPPSLLIEIDLGVPLARGLGSSATAIVGGLVGANQLAGNPLNRNEIINLAIEMEGHPDNVVPALLGNCLLSVKGNNHWEFCPISWHSEIIVIVAIPDFELSTQEARSVLPKSLNYHDAVFNISHLGLLIKALETNQESWLKVAMADCLHQPYRKGLIKGYDRVEIAAKDAGAYGLVISGAGPSLLALTNVNHQETVISAIGEAWKQEGIEAIVRSLSLDSQGARII
jgi:homoserine kinase